MQRAKMGSNLLQEFGLGALVDRRAHSRAAKAARFGARVVDQPARRRR
jgi:hypothetical protein